MIWRFRLALSGADRGRCTLAARRGRSDARHSQQLPPHHRQGFAGSSGDIGRWFQYLLLVVIVMAIATSFRFYFVSWLGRARRRRRPHRRPAQPAEARAALLRGESPSEIASRLTADTTIIEQVVGTTVSVALRNVVMGAGGLIYLFALSPKLTGMLLIGIPLVILPIVFLGRRVRDVSRASQDRIADVGSMVSEVLGAMKIVQSFNQQKREAGRFEDAVESVFSTAKRRIVLRALMTAIVISLIFGAITLVMWQGAIDVQAGRLSGGTIAAFVLTGALVAGALGALTEVYGDLLRGAGAAQRLAELMTQEAEIRAPA
jgi:ATP-binding cassette subfamily B protein